MNAFHPSPASLDWTAIENDAARLLSRYIQFDTTNPPGNEALALEFLAEWLLARGFEPLLLWSGEQRANLVVRLRSRAEPSAPPILLYAHADVVPASPTDWSVPPFGGHIKHGYVWGRGALDDKGLGVIFLQTLDLLKKLAVPLRRDVILLIAADEELRSQHGVAWLLDHHPDLIKAEFVWDEGGLGLRQPALPERYLYGIAVAEKKAMTVRLVAQGTPGHAALPQQNNPQDRLVRALNRISVWQRPARLTGPVIDMLHTLAPTRSRYEAALFSRAEKPLLWPLLRPLLEANPFFGPLIRNTVNLTLLRGGQASNVISAQAEAKLDIRLLPDEDPLALLADLRSVIADSKVSVEAEEIPLPHPTTSTDTDFFRALVQTLREQAPPGLVLPYLTPGATDSRFFRRAGMQAYGFMPMLLDSAELSRIHGIDERVSTANLRWGIQLVLETLQKLG